LCQIPCLLALRLIEMALGHAVCEPLDASDALEQLLHGVVNLRLLRLLDTLETCDLAHLAD
jgi:hypothetical protein